MGSSGLVEVFKANLAQTFQGCVAHCAQEFKPGLNAERRWPHRTLLYTTKILRAPPTLARHDEAGNAVGDAGAGGQKGDAHDDVGDAQGEADDGDLHINGMGAVGVDKRAVTL